MSSGCAEKLLAPGGTDGEGDGSIMVMVRIGRDNRRYRTSRDKLYSRTTTLSCIEVRSERVVLAVGLASPNEQEK